jgi:hypothetical protein
MKIVKILKAFAKTWNQRFFWILIQKTKTRGSLILKIFKKMELEGYLIYNFSRKWNWRLFKNQITTQHFFPRVLEFYEEPSILVLTKKLEWFWFLSHKKIGTSNLVLGSILQKFKNSTINFEKLRPSSNSDLGNP